MKKLLHKRYAQLMVVTVLSTPLFAYAGATLKNPTPGGGMTLQEFVLLLVEIVQVVTTPILAVCLIYGGFQFLTANGNEQQVTKAKQWIVWSLVGATIILGGKVIAEAVFGTASALK